MSLTAIGMLFAAALASAADSSSPAGLWKTIDDKTHQPRGLVRLYSRDGAIFGKIESSFDPKEADEVCDKCKDERRNQRVIGMVFLRNMRPKGKEYGGGDILDPDTGSVYRCKMKLEESGQKLVVRGFLGISLLGRSQTWMRAEEPAK
jgi:uncharacterized protein (DUF2147 family)